MKRVWINILSKLFLLVALMAYSACSDNIEPHNGIEPEEEEVDKRAFFSFQINSSRAISTDLGEYEELSERKVNAVRIVLYDATAANDEDAQVRYAFDFDIRSDVSGNGYIDGGSGDLPNLYANPEAIPNSNSFITYVREVEERDYRMLVIVNPGDKEEDSELLEITSPGQRLSEFLKPARMRAGTKFDNEGINAARPDNFVMTNHQGLVYIPKEKLQETEELANENPIPVTVDRTVAKVMVDEKEGGIEVLPVGATVSDLNWEIEMANKWSYRMRQITQKKNGSPEMQGDTDRANFYAIDPNYTGMIEAPDGDDRNYNYVIQPGPEHLPHSLGAYQYVLENTTAPSVNDVSMNTRAVVSCIYTPKGFEKGDSYFTYNNVAISQAKINEYKAAANENSFPPELTGLKEVIQDAEDELGITIDKPEESFHSSHGLNYYKNGLNYYTIPIRHFNNVKVGDYGYYGIVRNNVYIIRLLTIEGAGLPSDPGDEGPDDPEPPGPPENISADIEIIPWYGRSQNNEVGKEPHESDLTVRVWLNNTSIWPGPAYMQNVYYLTGIKKGTEIIWYNFALFNGRSIRTAYYSSMAGDWSTMTGEEAAMIYTQYPGAAVGTSITINQDTDIFVSAGIDYS